MAAAVETEDASDLEDVGSWLLAFGTWRKNDVVVSPKN